MALNSNHLVEEAILHNLLFSPTLVLSDVVTCQSFSFIDYIFSMSVGLMHPFSVTRF